MTDSSSPPEPDRTQWRAAWVQRKRRNPSGLTAYDKANAELAKLPKEAREAYARFRVLHAKRNRIWCFNQVHLRAKVLPQAVKDLICSHLENDPEVLRIYAEAASREARKSMLSLEEARVILASVARSSPLDFFDKDGGLKPQDQLTPQQRAALRKVKTKKRAFTSDRGEETSTEHEIEVIDKISAVRLDSLLAGYGADKEPKEDQKARSATLNLFFINPSKPAEKVIEADEIKTIEEPRQGPVPAIPDPAGAAPQ